ncbi:Dyp-type peroxidase [Bacillus inaquosorum]|uniref:Dyp-type peroxidase n=1 Tax=Bacillus inaquosorum TaxID=483913 RepID=UPI000A11CC2B|nr:Dyp-type peroxidase domain-containing protein [Bacillus inaquosorum]ARV43893.1 peroxidase [Bacillus subtilis]QJC88930.1 Ferrous iron transport peroxidase, EfeB like [Bacillus subtilis]WNW24246.1 Dyp-type peroxidase [Bacillus inaquosorum]
MNARLQEGIYHEPKTRPGKFFSILFLRVGSGLSASEVGEAFKSIWEMYQGLKKGEIRDLLGQKVPSGDLTVQIGYGPNIFVLPGVKRPLPANLKERFRFLSPLPTGGGLLLKGSGLQYANDVRFNPATEEIMIQFIAETQLAVNRAVIETWKILDDMSKVDSKLPPLAITSFYNGFQREDKRSWLDFHDGISNLKSEERAEVIKIKSTAEDKWTVGGTYSSFLRIGIDLSKWRILNTQQQELLVGRNKLNGCPLEAVDESGNAITQNGCPISGTFNIDDPKNEHFFEPPEVSDKIISQSHVQRANHHIPDHNSKNSSRIFRQGYEFLEAIDRSPGFQAGLNFVSFQDTPERLFRILTQDGWLGKTNFGGDPDNPLSEENKLLTIRAAGIFLIPPIVEDEVFPGSRILL